MDVIWIILLFLLLLVALYLLFLMTASSKDAERMNGMLYAHRGYHNMTLGIPENSIAAFRRARAFGYGVEFDIQLTKDNKVVVFHDESLKRMCGIDRNVRDLTYEQLRRYRLLETDQTVPLLEEVLETVGHDTPILCEIKVYGGYTNTVICRVALPLLRAYRSRMVIESFNPFALHWFRKNAPEFVRGQLSCSFRNSKDGPNPVVGFLAENLIFNVIGFPAFLAYRHSDSGNISFALAKKLYRPVTVAWTLHSEKEQRTASNNGYNAFIFEGYQASPMPPRPQRRRS